MRQLGISGAETKISLTTLEKKDSIIDSFISDLDENVFFELAAPYTRPGIPVWKDDIPKQVDVDRWPHLSGVSLPDVEAGVGLLIASDVPMALDPLEAESTANMAARMLLAQV